MTISETDAANDEFNLVPAGAPAAVQNRADLRKHNGFAVALVGPPGAGKTALREATARQLCGKGRVAVITINPAAVRDADRLSRYCEHVQAITTAVPDASAIRQALQRLDLPFGFTHLN